jgi:hypothetical protein
MRHHVLDQLLEHGDARGPADDLGMHRQDVLAVLAVERVEFVDPALEHGGRGMHRPARQRDGVEEEGRVIEHPGEGELDDVRLPAVDDVQVGRVVVEVVGGILEAVFLQQPERERAELAGRRAVAARRLAGHALDDLHAFVHLLALLLGREIDDPGMRPGVMADLVAALERLLDQRLALLDDDAGDEERRLDVVAVEQVEDAAHSHLPSVAALAQRDRTLRVLGVARGPQRLGIEIEGEHDGEALRRNRHGGGPFIGPGWADVTLEARTRPTREAPART